MQKIIRKTILIFFIIAIIFTIINLFNIKEKIYKNMYPIKYEEYVYKYSNQNNVDPLLIFAIIKAESNFDENAVSKSDAKGLMQILEETAEETKNKELEEEFDKNMLLDPEENIKIGTTYFSILLDRYDGNIGIALAAYNAGIGKVDSWIDDGIIRKDGQDLENIPYKETNNYVRKILRDYKIYQEIY